MVRVWGIALRCTGLAVVLATTPTQLYDGTRLYVGAGTMTFPVDTWLLDRVDVLRGPASVIHGVGAIGSAMNYVPRQPLRSGSLTDALFSDSMRLA
ncbi:MAG: hypothetical protein FJZ47_17150 [Candidatus Tectomicrobia bacterium]|uniref:TonB-dependent receptor plug domain-containing protein n=1 Tax=Tectimicrobiota bacterium TaxID=2528274 RepID=A0A938B3X4_UNCTE|nr:hypothetical protein [Candidatus Tectomicrobia bacterium]